jgi:hypothetical protein
MSTSTLFAVPKGGDQSPRIEVKKILPERRLATLFCDGVARDGRLPKLYAILQQLQLGQHSPLHVSFFRNLASSCKPKKPLRKKGAPEVKPVFELDPSVPLLDAAVDLFTRFRDGEEFPEERVAIVHALVERLQTNVDMSPGETVYFQTLAAFIRAPFATRLPKHHSPRTPQERGEEAATMFD